MDEPFGALDAQTRVVMQEELVRLARVNPRTVLFITHGVEEAVYLADRVAIMTRRPGRIKEIIDVKPIREAENWDELPRIEDVMDLESFVHLRTHDLEDRSARRRSKNGIDQRSSRPEIIKKSTGGEGNEKASFGPLVWPAVLIAAAPPDRHGANVDQCQLSARALLGAAVLHRHREGMVEGASGCSRNSRSSPRARRKSRRRRRSPGTSAARVRCRPCSAPRASGFSRSASPMTNRKPMRSRCAREQVSTELSKIQPKIMKGHKILLTTNSTGRLRVRKLPEEVRPRPKRRAVRQSRPGADHLGDHLRTMATSPAFGRRTTTRSKKRPAQKTSVPAPMPARSFPARWSCARITPRRTRSTSPNSWPCICALGLGRRPIKGSRRDDEDVLYAGWRRDFRSGSRDGVFERGRFSCSISNSRSWTAPKARRKSTRGSATSASS